MKKMDFFNTSKGKKHLRFKRELSRLYFCVNQEPKSKKSITSVEKVNFQKEIFARMTERKRRPYRTPLLMEIDFYSSIKNQPSIHTLTKNYLDLLEKPVAQSGIGWKNLLYKNDKLVKVLIVNHRICSKKETPCIFIQTSKLSDYLTDLELIRDLSLLDNYEDDDDNSFVNEELMELKKSRGAIIKKIGEKKYRVQEDYWIERVQDSLLYMSKMKLFQLIGLFSSLFKTKRLSLDELVEKVDLMSRNLIISSNNFFIKKVGPPQKGKKQGDGKKEFKVEIEKALKDFLKKYPIFVPMKKVLSVTILYIPPKGVSGDLDNLARLIIPRIIAILNPPSNLLKRINLEDRDDKDFVKFIKSRLADMENMPDSMIPQYQVIEVPRCASDSADGVVKLIFESDIFSRSILKKTDRIIDDWYRDDDYDNN